MSSLVFCADEEEVLVATDTLAVRPGGRPFNFTTKAFIVPHLKVIMAGTGIGGFLGRWFFMVNDRYIVRGIDDLNHYAPAALASLWQGYKQEFSIPEGKTMTVYHFGFSELMGVIHMFAYRSRDAFRSEVVRYGIGTRPPLPVSFNDLSLPRDLKKIMDEQRRIEASKPKGERLYIGGEIQVCHLSRAGFGIYTTHRFEDYAHDETAMSDDCRDSQNMEP